MIDTLGVYGGTFSPPHCGHYHAAEAFIRAINPDRLLIIPTYIPPHKTETDGVTAADRLNMCRIAFSGLSGAVVSDMEIRRGAILPTPCVRLPGRHDVLPCLSEPT